ncbi:phytanoyl-CoA dioxygenase family protein [Plantactinospora soyae]|uniref:Phytanoyl-CoA dioxygenase n=1 Tax=Plantactinospora soyae TaxID=1544732 RepID=A0A927MAE2_9ACTN|nr:phytanoyl-CoA dioxygenase family protein [Plantactinospora soyae]MBE1489516.1 hypothetical protein [Plantactinospora soyae]
MGPLLESTLDDHLRERLRRDGYVYLPGLRTDEETGPLLADLRRVLADAGWLADPVEWRVAAEAGLTANSFWTVYPAVQALESLHRFAHGTRVRQVARAILGGEVFCHPAKVARLTPPTTVDRAYSTDAHQDFVKLHVEPDVLTVWTALTPCSPDRQGLRVLAGSHRRGFLAVEPELGRSLPVYLPVAADDPRWLTADFAVGDVVVFHSLTVHGGGPNRTSELRLSTDVRYQRRDAPMRPEHAQPHGWPETPGWESLTAGWRDRSWVTAPPDVVLRPMPVGVSYAEYLAELSVPRSRLLGR